MGEANFRKIRIINLGERSICPVTNMRKLMLVVTQRYKEKSIYCETKPTAWLALRRWADLFEALNKSALYHGAILKTRL